MDIREIIYKTLIAGDSYITLLKGLGATLQISLLSVVLGTLLGMAVCAMRRSQFWMMRQIAAGYIAILRGSPVLLLLMLMYYVVFAGSHVSATIVAVAAFSLHMSAYTAACFYSAILLAILYAVIHFSEVEGTPHLHVCFQPEADCTRGLAKQVSIGRALAQDGIERIDTRAEAEQAGGFQLARFYQKFHHEYQNPTLQRLG